MSEYGLLFLMFWIDKNSRNINDTAALLCSVLRFGHHISVDSLQCLIHVL